MPMYGENYGGRVGSVNTGHPIAQVAGSHVYV